VKQTTTLTLLAVPAAYSQATPLFSELCRRALQLVSSCPCPYPRGCPACVQHLECKNYNAVISKRGALLVLQVGG
jgi:DEAD/DEAH box helicase domain-containing protein